MCHLAEACNTADSSDSCGMSWTTRLLWSWCGTRRMLSVRARSSSNTPSTTSLPTTSLFWSSVSTPRTYSHPMPDHGIAREALYDQIRYMSINDATRVLPTSQLIVVVPQPSLPHKGHCMRNKNSSYTMSQEGEQSSRCISFACNRYRLPVITRAMVHYTYIAAEPRQDLSARVPAARLK
jgi:hypothetical protein